LTVVPELNVIKKDWREVDLKIGLCYPNVYRAGMSGLTMKLLYALFNVRDDVLCERFFVPTLKEPWTSFESNQPMKKFDVAAFTLQYEEDYVNAIQMLARSGIPPRREDRKNNDPIVIAGGPCATANPEPLADLIDLFVIGEVEPILDVFVDQLKALKDRRGHIEVFADINGVYVPQILNPTRRVWAQNLDEAKHPVAQQVPIVDDRSPYMTIFGRTLTVEETRGCSRHCRFCLLRYISHPMRERSLAKIEEIVNEGMKMTPVGKISLIGAGISDHSRLEDVCEFIVSNGYELSIPSVRPESITENLAKLLAKGKQRNVSLAPDAASPRMREIICKQIDEEILVNSTKILLGKGVNRLKLYFMVGLPGETIDDVKAIAKLCKGIGDAGYGSKAIHLSINPLIPKPHTPFQWEKMTSVSYVRESLNLLRRLFKGDRRFVIEGMEPRHAQIQAFLSRGDRGIGKTVELAAIYGGGLGAWRRAMKETGIVLEDYLREKKFDERLPWDSISVGLNKRYLSREAESFKRTI
jgi:radical SAM superfamily enzyme YgiQ (UPF0313 family)